MGRPEALEDGALPLPADVALLEPSNTGDTDNVTTIVTEYQYLEP